MLNNTQISRKKAIPACSELNVAMVLSNFDATRVDDRDLLEMNTGTVSEIKMFLLCSPSRESGFCLDTSWLTCSKEPATYSNQAKFALSTMITPIMLTQQLWVIDDNK